MIIGLDHIAVAVESLESAIPPLVKGLGLRHTATEEVDYQHVRVASVEGGGVTIELVQKTSDESPITGFLAKRGPGVHHIAYRVEDLDAALQELKAAGVRLIDETPRPGAFGKRIAFIHPKATGGILFELCQEASGKEGAP
jgi:methylmalonyl-CoA epimerase